MVHTPALSILHLHAVNYRCSLEFNDSSWKGDETDSCQTVLKDGTIVCILFPNRKAGYTKFAVNYFNEHSHKNSIYLTHNGSEDMSLEEAVATVEEFIKQN